MCNGVYNIWGLSARSYIIYCMIPFLHWMGCPQVNMLDSLHILDIDSTIVLVIIILVPIMIRGIRHEFTSCKKRRII